MCIWKEYNPTKNQSIVRIKLKQNSVIPYSLSLLIIQSTHYPNYQLNFGHGNLASSIDELLDCNFKVGCVSNSTEHEWLWDVCATIYAIFERFGMKQSVVKLTSSLQTYNPSR